MKKEETPITLKNGGMHSQTNYRKCKEMIRTNEYNMPRLYHLVFTASLDATESPKEADYLYVVNALAKKLRDNKVPCKWKACLEVDEKKGLHLHLMLLLDANQGGRPDYWIRYAEDGWLVLLLKERGMGFNISQPRNKIHRTKLGKKQNYAYITKVGPKLEDALIWCSYLYKKRSKDDSMKTIYHSSRERVVKSLPPPAALPAAKQEAVACDATAQQQGNNREIGLNGSEVETKQPIKPLRNDLNGSGSIFIIPDDSGIQILSKCPKTRLNGSEGHSTVKEISMELTPMQIYVASLYEEAVDLGLDVDTIRKHLLERGVKRTPLQLEDDLENVYGFYGYYSSHKAEPAMSVAAYDMSIERGIRN